jgi:asparagine synthase (glutamine-hydrolysing)
MRAVENHGKVRHQSREINEPMCGIAGIHDPISPQPADALLRLAAAMARTLIHRGPDEGQTWADGTTGTGFGFQRLAIQDVSAGGRQPMTSASGRCTIAYNGEIYSSAEMRAQLGAGVPRYRGHSDTEVLLEACEAWGVERTLPQLIGKFAFALIERDTRRLWLVRDRMGIKPLYWTRWGGGIAFASELRALRVLPGIANEIDRDTLSAYVRHAYFPNPHTVYRGVQQLPPGHFLCLEPGKAPHISPYWTLAGQVENGRANPFAGGDSEATDTLENLLTDAVRRRMIADVPLGAFLSGGYDSSTVVALMQKTAARPVRTFSIGFEDESFDEARHAKAVARHLGTDHTELYVTPKDALDVIPKLADIYDEPFADPSQIPTYLVSKLARQHVTVALSGDGGDELFAGYNRYSQADLIRRRAGLIPEVFRRAGAHAIRQVSPGAWDRFFALAPARLRIPAAGDKLYKLADVAAADPDAFYMKLVSCWQDPGAVVSGAHEPMTAVSDPRITAFMPDFVDRMQYRDTLTYLPDDILAKVDRASMAVSLEARVPLIDHRVVAFAWSLPQHFKLRQGERKWLLRQVLYRHVPPHLVDRPKMGFGVPIDRWLRGPLRDWAEDLLDEQRLKEGGLIDPVPVRARWAEHLSGRRNWQYSLWTILMLEAWRRRWQGTQPHQRPA